MRRITPERQSQILAILEAEMPAGISCARLARRMKLSEGFAGYALQDLQRIGRAELCGTRGPGCRWGLPGIAAHFAARNASMLAERQRQRDNKHANKEAVVFAAAWSETAPTHSLVPAHAAPPLRPAGPRDVWALAAA